MSDHKITPNLWFSSHNGSMLEVVSYYKEIFGKHLEAGQIIPLGDTPGGYTEMCEMNIFNQRYSCINTSKEHHHFNDAIAFTIHCEDQDEIDTYWNYFTHEGKESQCGWCIDKYGLRWQILPKNFDTLMKQPHAWEVMMSQTRIIMEEYV